MCLHKLDDYEVKKNIGYKLFRMGNTSNGYRSLYNRKCPEMIIDKKYIDKNEGRIDAGVPFKNGKYQTGYHIYLKLKDACEELKAWKGPLLNGIYTNKSKVVLIKVRFGKVVAKGWEFDRKVIVAREMTLVKEVK